ncbi:MAG: DNA primase, partial [Pirellulaceae bacterium]
MTESDELLQRMPEIIRESARQMLESEHLIELVANDLKSVGIAGEYENAITTYLVGTSRLLAKPLSAIIQGPSSSGKSYIIEKVAALFPSESVLMATQQTQQALFYLEPGSLSHRFVVAGERSRVENDDSAEASRALREMMSAGRLSKLVTIKKGNRFETELVEQDGPIAYIESTTLSKVFEEDANRCLMLHTDERRGQTERIIQSLAANYSRSQNGDKDQIVQKHHAMQRMLKQWDVVIPFAEKLGELFGSDRVEARRAFPQLMSMIQASCLLHQRQRKMTTDGVLDATEEDYRIARHFLAGQMSRLLG